MIPITNTVTNEQSGIVKEFDYTIKQKNFHFIFQFLRDKCYKDPVRAVIREYCTNAQDVHIKLGLIRPFEVHLPTELDCFFRVRDFGNALTDDQIKDIYVSYGESDKRDNDAETGMLGLGSKSGFAYGSKSFMVNSYRNGKVTSWNSYIDSTELGKMAQMVEMDTTEPDGLEVVIAVNYYDINEFRSKAIEKVFPYFDFPPKVTNITETEQILLDSITNSVGAFYGNGWKYLGGHTQSIAVMGSVAYPIDPTVFTSQEIEPEIKEFVKNGIVIKFKNDARLNFAISREELQYTPETKKVILARLHEIVNDITSQAEAKFKGCKTLWDAKIMWNEVFRVDSYVSLYKELFNKRIHFNNRPLNKNYFVCTSSEMCVDCYSKKDSYERVKKVGTYKIEASYKNLVVVNDKNIANGILNRVIGPIKTGKFANIYVIKFNNQAAKDTWIAESGYDGPMESLTTLPKQKLSTFYGCASNVQKNAKHQSQEFLYDPNQSFKNSKNSDYWKACEIDLANDGGVYVEIERFVPVSGKANIYSSIGSFNDILKSLQGAGVSIPQIYGFKKNSIARAVANPNLVNFWVWVEKAIENLFISNPNLAQDYANRNYCRGQMETLHTGLPVFGNIVLKWSSIPATSELIQFFAKVNLLSKYDYNKFYYIDELIQKGFSITYPSKVPSYEVKNDYVKLAKRYPLLFQTAKKIGGECMGREDWSKPFEEYVAMVDLVTP